MQRTRSTGCLKLAAYVALLLSLGVRASDASSGVGHQRAVLSGALEVGGESTELRLAAKRLSYRPAGARPCPATGCAGRLALSGAVRLEVGELRLTADSAEVLLDAGGKLRRATARGSVVLASRQGSGRATGVEIAVHPALVVELTGDAELVVKTLGLRLRGSRIALDLTTGQAVVHEARAALSSARGLRAGGGR